eukprot:352245-Chlamydomonas_euryale.AAC.2
MDSKAEGGGLKDTLPDSGPCLPRTGLRETVMRRKVQRTGHDSLVHARARFRRFCTPSWSSSPSLTGSATVCQSRAASPQQASPTTQFPMSKCLLSANIAKISALDAAERAAVHQPGLIFLVSNGSTPSGDDSSQHSDAGVSMGGLSDGHGGPDDILAPSISSDAMTMTQAGPGGELSGG